MAQLLIDKSILDRMAAEHERRIKKGESPDSLMVLTFDGVEIPKEFFFLPEDELEVNASEYDTVQKENEKTAKKLQQGLAKQARLRSALDREIRTGTEAGRPIRLKSA